MTESPKNEGRKETPRKMEDEKDVILSNKGDRLKSVTIVHSGGVNLLNS